MCARIYSNKTKRLREHLELHLKENGPKTSRELLDYYNQVSRQGSTMNSLTNVLAKDPRFCVHRTVRIMGHDSSSYEMLMWCLTDPSEEE